MSNKITVPFTITGLSSLKVETRVLRMKNGTFGFCTQEELLGYILSELHKRNFEAMPSYRPGFEVLFFLDQLGDEEFFNFEGVRFRLQWMPYKKNLKIVLNSYSMYASSDEVTVDGLDLIFALGDNHNT